jgi:hypothetical protein
MSKVATYRKKPVEIQAIQYTGENAPAVVEFAFDAGTRNAFDGTDNLIIPTLEGDMTANPGDYIIKGVKGEFYPCKPDIFEATYEPC